MVFMHFGQTPLCPKLLINVALKTSIVSGQDYGKNPNDIHIFGQTII